MLSAIVIALSAFFSMLERPQTQLDIRKKLTEAIRIVYDQFMLAQSYSLGALAKKDKFANPNNPEYQLLRAYKLHFQNLKENNTIANEKDYQIFDD